MTVIIFNLPGIIITLIAFAATFVIGHVAGITAEGPLMTILGPLCTVLDLAYRFRQPERSWFRPSCGGHLFFMPVWVLGALWAVLGEVYIIQERP